MKKFTFFIVILLFSTSIYSKKNYKALETYAKVLKHIEEQYYKEVDIEKLIYLSIKGIFKGLDPHSEFMNKKEYGELSNQLEGSYVGIGVELEIREDEIYIIRVLKNSPAEKQGIIPGGTIEKIDNRSVYNIGLDKVEDVLNGEMGTVVTLSYFYKSRLKKYKVVRDKIVVKPIEFFEIGKNIVYIKIESFQENLSKIFKNELLKYKKRDFIIDLRGNPGGFVNEAINISNFFIDKGVIVYSKERRKTITYKAESKGTIFKNNRLILLIDGDSASASEIFAGAIKDNKRGVVIGVKSYGKGSIQSIYQLKNGTGLKLTVALYLTPNKKLIQGKGITPHISMPKFFEFKNIERESDLKNAIKVKADKEKKFKIPKFLKKDRHFEAAIKYLKDPF